MNKTKFVLMSFACVLMLAGAACIPETPVDTTTTTPDSGVIPTTSIPTTTDGTTVPTTTDTNGGQPTTSATSTVMENMARVTELITFGAALQSAELVEGLHTGGPFTIFAPTNEALNELPSSTVQMLLGSSNRQNLRNLLNFHIVRGNYPPDELENGESLTTVNGERVTISSEGGMMSVNGAQVDDEPIVSRNGIIYSIDKVLFPRNFRGAPTSTATQ